MHVSMINGELRLAPENNKEREMLDTAINKLKVGEGVEITLEVMTSVKRYREDASDVSEADASFRPKGMQAMPGTPETGADPRNPNLG